ncbi:HEPN domain-containing protein [Rubrivirga sp.]|uniref:HEPN domain-containing protein n=1 Tax=Rubrivirga sp. TaxID=1885344 RepID=UPI003B5178EF
MSRGPLHQARVTLAAARVLAALGFSRDAVSRAYFAAFYAARAALANRGSEPSTHRGVAVEFSRLLVRTGDVDVTTGRALRRLADARMEADYDDGERFSPADIAVLVGAADRFVAAVATVLGAPPVPTVPPGLTDDQKRDLVAQLTREMEAAAENLEFEKAAELRDSIAQIEADLAA